MTQPPQGGFGPPRTPPPPQPPARPQQGAPPLPAPPWPGYGYPQAPQGAPQIPTPGYGYPQATVPTHPRPAGPGDGGRRFKARSAVVVAAVVAIALIIGGGVLYAESGDEGRKDDSAGAGSGTGSQDAEGGSTAPRGSERVPGNTAAKVLFQVPSPRAQEDRGTGAVVPGSWLTEKAYVRSGVAEVVGYDPAKGTERWTIPLPGPVCTTTGHTTEGHLTAIVHEPAMPSEAAPTHGCTQVSAIDLDTGEKLWTQTARRGGEPMRFDNVTVSADTVAVGGTGGGAAFDIASGTPLWTPKATDTCHDAGYGGGPKLVALRKCGSDGRGRLHVQTIDPKSGQVISVYTMDEGIEYAGIVSTDPLVVAADVGADAGATDGRGTPDFFSIDNKTGRLRARISTQGRPYAAECGGIRTIERCPRLVVGNDRLYLPTEEHDGGGGVGPTNEIVSFDLATGKPTRQRAGGGDGYVIAPLRMDGGNVIAYKRSPYGRSGQVVSIDGGTFEQTELLEFPATEAVRDTAAGTLPEHAEYIYSQGRLYLSQGYASGPTGPGEKEYLVIAFGTGA